MHSLLWIGVTLFLCFKASHTNVYIELYNVTIEFRHSVFKPELEDYCSLNGEDAHLFYQRLFGEQSCFQVWQNLKVSTNPCKEFWYNNDRIDDIGIQEPMERAVIVYCNGTHSPTRCFECFNAAVDHVWYRHPCKTVSNLEKITYCMSSHINNEFQWSRDVILNKTKKIVAIDLSSTLYEDCYNRFAGVDRFTIKFPIRIPHVRKEVEEEFDVFLSLFLNAFGSKSQTIRFRCGDFIKGGYLSRYYLAVIQRFSNTPDSKIVQAFWNVREDMCEFNHPIDDCARCYTIGDDKFMYYLSNNNTEIDSVVKDFTKINEIYEKCYRETKSIDEYNTKIWGSHSGSEQLIQSCEAEFKYLQRGFDEFKLLHERTEAKRMKSYKDKFDVVLKVMTFNFFSYFGYGLKQQVAEDCLRRHQDIGQCSLEYQFNRCPLNGFRHLSCMLHAGCRIIERLRDELTDSEADDAINAFALMLSGGCPDA